MTIVSSPLQLPLSASKIWFVMKLNTEKLFDACYFLIVVHYFLSVACYFSSYFLVLFLLVKPFCILFSIFFFFWEYLRPLHARQIKTKIDNHAPHTLPAYLYFRAGNECSKIVIMVEKQLYENEFRQVPCFYFRKQSWAFIS